MTNQIIKSQHPFLYVIFASIIAGMSGVLFGYDTGVISGALIFLKKDFVINPNQEGIIVSILLFGAAVGALGVSKIADKVGRKKLLIMTGILFILGTYGLAKSLTINELYIYRFILGLSIGIASFAAPSYISEIAPSHLRGRLVSFFQLAIVIGILLTYIVNYYLATSTNPWREMFLYGTIPAIILLLGLFFMPDSPRWLLSRGKDEEAIKALRKLRGNKFQNELEEIKATLNLEHKKSNWNELFTRKNVPIISIAIIIMFFQQLSGINAIIYYAPKIFLYAGLGINNSFLSTILVGLVNLISTIIGLLLLDKLGRRPLMIGGSLLMAFALAMVALTFHENMSNVESMIGVGSILVYIFAFAISTGLFGWLIISEIFPLSVRGEGAAIGATANWVFNIMVSFSFPVLLNIFGINIIFAFFAVICLMSFWYCIKYLPETKGVSLETIETNLLQGVKSRNLGVKE